jgi:tetratricopeptide (TPR) repeat protein
VKKHTLLVSCSLLLLMGAAQAQRVGLYPLETTDQNLGLAVPTAISRALETIDGAVAPAPLDLFQAVKQRPAFNETLDKIFGLEVIVTGKLEGASGAYTATYSVKRGSDVKTITVRAANFAVLIKNSNAELVKAIGFKPTPADAQELAALEKNLPSAEVVAATGTPGQGGSAAALEGTSQNPWALATRGLLLLSSGKFEEGLALTTQASKLAPQDPWVQTNYVGALLATRKNDEARTAIDAGLKLNPAKPELHYLQARQLLRATTISNDIANKALEAANRALQYNPRYLDAAVLAADIYENFGDSSSAANVLVRLVPRMPDDAGLHSRILDTLLENDRDDATNYMNDLLRTYPDVPDTVYALAVRLFDTNTAKRLVATGETRYAQSAPLAYARGFLEERVGNYMGAVTAYQQSLERNDKYARAGIALAGALSKLGRFDEAEAALKSTTGGNDQKVLARMYLQTGRLDRAKAVLEKLTADFDTNYYSGVLALRDYNVTEAQKALEAAVKLKSDDSRPKVTLTELADVKRLGAPKLTGDALYQFRLGQALLDSGNPLEAQSAFERVLKSAPNDVHAALYRAIALTQTASPDDAVDAFETLMKTAPNNVVVMAYAATAYIQQSRFDLAIDVASAAITKDKTYARAYYVLGLANLYLQNAVPAREAMLKCVGADATFKVLVDPILNRLK